MAITIYALLTDRLNLGVLNSAESCGLVCSIFPFICGLRLRTFILILGRTVLYGLCFLFVGDDMHSLKAFGNG